MSETTFEGQCWSLYEGRTTFDEFARATRLRWSRTAAHLMRRWRQPQWHGLEDVEQELLVGVWETIWKFDPAYARRKGVTLSRYLVYNAIARTKKSLHRARGASLSGTADKNKGTIETPFSAYDDEAQQWLEAQLAGQGEQEAFVETLEACDRARGACRTRGEVLVIEAVLSAGDLEGGAAALFADVRGRGTWALESESEAARLVARVVSEVADRLVA